ncbi:MAG: DUF5686 and carboxypeptidase regulatory-like domain-containing protein [Tannerella sp.]|nr:DUF5686 and carboxypeptidase regulatory-like domain-containing protein [Tannerella sp.]
MNEKGEAIPYATIYVEEIALGIVSDDHGEFQTTLEKGQYTFVVSSLGHEKKKIPVTISEKETTLEIVLQEKIYQLNEVTVKAGGEDPAYPIMRKAIVMAPFYLNQVRSYQANIYLKGTLKVDKIPALIRRRIKDPRLKDAVNKLFLIESQNKVTFTAPDKYDQEVVALSTTIPLELDNDIAMGVINSNIYSPNIMAIVSPLAPNAFSHYQYKLEGMSMEGEHLVNKIKVIPKKNNAQLVRGYIYIVENYWNVQQANLSVSQSGVTVQFNVAYHEVRPGAFLPTSYDMKMNMDVMGVKGEAKYYSSVQYNRVDINSQYTIPPSKTIDEQVTKESKQLVKVQKKLRNKDLEVKSRDSVFRITHDTLSLLRDSVYWLEVRQLPLRPEEIISYQIKDSLKLVADSIKQADSLQNRTFSTWVKNLVLGEKIKLHDKYTIGYGGILRACPEYNFVDGFWLGQKFHFGIDFSKKRSLTIIPSVHYLTARKEISWQVENSFKYDPLRHGNLTITAGNMTADYAGTNGTGRFNNALSSLLFADNTAKFYQAKFVNASHQIDLAHALRFTVNVNYEKRNTLDNNTSYSFFGGRPEPNNPNELFPPMLTHTSFRTGVQLQYTPRYHYRIWRGEKIYLYSNYPTFMLSYEKGIPFNNEDASYDKLEASIKQSIRLNTFNRIHYTIDAGIFPSSKTVYLPDYKHFGINEPFIAGGSLTNRFNLLSNYQYVTNDKWLHGDIELSSDYLLLKNIRFMQDYLFDESLHLRSLWIPGRNYTEFGYSIGFGDIARVGVFVGLDNGAYDKIGCTISLPIIQALLRRE